MTDDEVAAAALEGALRLRVEMDGQIEPDHVLVQFAVVSFWLPMSESGRSRYTLTFSNDLPAHSAVGLLTVGAGMLAEQMDDDDE